MPLIENLVLVPRNPVPEDRRLGRFTEIVSDLLNSLVTRPELFRVGLSGVGPDAYLIVSPVRVVTAAGAVTVAHTDGVIVVNKTVGAATTVSLPSNPVLGRRLTVKDGKGDASTNNITLDPAGATTIDGAATYVLAADYGSADVVWNGTQWNVI